MANKLPLMSKLGVIFLTWRRSLQKDLVPHDITLKQEYVLNQLAKTDYLQPSLIAEMLFCDRPTATVVIGNMERKRWVKRERDAENGKQVRVSITGEGIEKLASISRKAEAGEKNAFDPLACFTPEEKEQLDKLLTKLHKHVKTLENR